MYTMHIRQRFTRWALPSLCLLQCLHVHTQSLSPTFTGPATCFQTHASSTMNEDQRAALTGSDSHIDKACDPSSRSVDEEPYSHTFYRFQDFLFFNSSLEIAPSSGSQTLVPTGASFNQPCIVSFNTILSSCIFAGLAGGWIEDIGINYTSKKAWLVPFVLALADSSHSHLCQVRSERLVKRFTCY